MGNLEEFGNVTDANAEFFLGLEAVKESSHSRRGEGEGEMGRGGDGERGRGGDGERGRGGE
ncbi:MAG: hypothetical protein F6K58_31685, partial [Symploca sp. SIO2E9]|nr:hypothetical protein [Symploca sp. SIO2E9]